MKKVPSRRTHGSIRRLRSGSYQILLKLKGRQYSEGTFERYQDAQKRLAKALVEIDEGVYIAAQRATNPTLAQFLEDYLESRALNEPGTLRNFHQQVRRLTVVLGQKRIRDIKQSDVEAAQKMMATTLSAKTIHDAIKFAATAFKWAMSRDEPLVGRNPFATVKVPVSEVPEVKVLTAAEASRLLNVLEGWPEANYANMLAVALLTMRRLFSAFGALRWCDVNFIENRVSFRQVLLWGIRDGERRYTIRRPNNRKHRPDEIEVPDKVMEFLRRQQEWQRQVGLPDPAWSPMQFVFTTIDGNPILDSTLRKAFRRILTAAQLERRRVHDLRHTGASLLLAAGTPLIDVQRLGGWRDVGTVLGTYGHLLPGGVRAAAEQLAQTLHDGTRTGLK